MAFRYPFEILSGSRSRPSENLDFFGGWVIKSYLRPEEVDLALVSKGLPFNLSTDSENWNVFCTKLQRLVTQMDDAGQVADTFPEPYFTKDRVRLVVCSNAPLNRGPFSWEEGQEEITLPMKVKLISDIPLELLPSSIKEQGCLYRLSKVCGAQNVRLAIQKLGGEGLYPRLEQPLQLEWNEETLAWEADTQVTFQKCNLETFGTAEHGFYSPLGGVELKLNDNGVGRVLEQIYRKPGTDNSLLREMLEEGTFSDSGIISETDKEPIQCHRVQMAAASRVFADMLKNSWKEAETQTVKLPESREAILALLHFIYYGGTQRILDAGMNVVLELLQAGHKYSIPTLVDVTAFVLRAKSELMEKEWWSVDGAVDLFCFARNVDGDLWNTLCRLCYKYLEYKELDELKACQGYLNMYQIAVKLGPVFEYVLAMKRINEPGALLEQDGLPSVPEGMSKADVELIFDFMCSSWIQGCNLEIIVGVVVLADYCGRVIPQCVVDIIETFPVGWQHYVHGKISVDFLVELFWKSRTKQGKCWEHLKIMAVRKLKDLLTKQPNETEASEKYMEMFRTDFKAAAEFTKLCMMDCATKEMKP